MSEASVLQLSPLGEPQGGSRPPRVLVVDDQTPVRTMMLRILRQGGYEAEEAEDASQARLALADRPFDAVLIDARMPGESGIDLLLYVHRNHVDTAPVMVTALEDEGLIQTAFEAGAFGYVVKPFRARDLLINVTNALYRRRREMGSRIQIRDLEALVQDRTRRLNEVLGPLQDPDLMSISAEEAIAELSNAVTIRDEETGAHILRMSNYAALLAERAGIAGTHPQRIRLAAALHDVGKIGIPDAVLLKPGRLTPEEYVVMQRHTVIGHDMLSKSSSPLLRLGAAIALTHHERWDGGGYPNGLAGEAIPPEGRVAAIADVFDALTSHRVYRPAMELEAALAIMRQGRATHFDPDLLDLFLGSLDDVLQLRTRYQDEPQ